MTPLRLLLLGACVAVAAASAGTAPVLDHVAVGAGDVEPGVEEQVYDPTTRDEALAQIERAGLYILDVESIVRHVHAELTLVVDGVPVTVPQAGVDFDSMTAAPVHTHGTDGVLHIESDAAHEDVEIRLGHFFAILGAGTSDGDLCRFYLQLPPSACSVRVTVDGRPSDLDHVLGDGEEIRVDVTSGSGAVQV